MKGTKSMRAEEQLQFMMDFHGDLFWNRQKCLDHLFCSIGNGYKWVDGELVAPYNADLLARWGLKFPIEKAEPCLLVKSLGETTESMYEMRNKRQLEEGKPIVYHKWYPLSKEYSYLYNYPDNIKHDWLALIEECKQMLIDDGIEV